MGKPGDSPSTLVPSKVGPFVSDRDLLQRQLSRRGAMVARRFPMNFIGEGCEFDPRRRYIFVQFIGLGKDGVGKKKSRV